MADDATAELKRQLGADVKILGSLTAAQSKKLVGLMADARVQQQKSLEVAMEGALSHIPMLLRGPVRKILGL